MSDVITVETVTANVLEVVTEGPAGPQGSSGVTGEVGPQGPLGPDPTTTKGDVSTHDGTDPTRLPIGTNDDVLTADSATATGLKWVSAAFASVTLLTQSNSIGPGATEVNPWLDTNHSSFTENTDWKHNIVAQGVVYGPTTGKFIVDTAGTYMIFVSIVSLQDGGSTMNTDVRLRINGTEKFLSRNMVQASTDPVALPINIILALSVNDEITVTVQPETLAIFIDPGSVFNIHKI